MGICVTFPAVGSYPFHSYPCYVRRESLQFYTPVPVSTLLNHSHTNFHINSRTDSPTNSRLPHLPPGI